MLLADILRTDAAAHRALPAGNVKRDAPRRVSAGPLPQLRQGVDESRGVGQVRQQARPGIPEHTPPIGRDDKTRA